MARTTRETNRGTLLSRTPPERFDLGGPGRTRKKSSSRPFIYQRFVTGNFWRTVANGRGPVPLGGSKDQPLRTAVTRFVSSCVPLKPMCRQGFDSDDVSSPFILLRGLRPFHRRFPTSAVFHTLTVGRQRALRSVVPESRCRISLRRPLTSMPRCKGRLFTLRLHHWRTASD